VSLSLPDEVRAALTEAGLSEDEVLVMTGDELVVRIGAEMTYELVVALDAQGRAIGNYPGREGRRSSDDDLRKRNIEILRLRLVGGLNYAMIGSTIGLTRSRISQILTTYYGLDKKPGRAKSVTIPVEALDVTQEALRHQLADEAESLLACLRSGSDISDALSSFDEVRYLMRDVDANDDVEIYVGRKRGSVLIEALRKQLSITRYIADDPSTKGKTEQRRLDDAAMIERVVQLVLR
jgi:hypothetical protein